MNQQEPAVYNLEFFGDAPFWEGAEELSRRTFLMPLSNRAEFLAFGVADASKTVLFVARGRVQEHLGGFLERMARAGASVELYERVPLPWPLVKRYTSDSPFEGQETEGPPESSDPGIVYGGGADGTLINTTLDISASPTWPSTADSSTRKVFIMPLHGDAEFLAMGVCGDTKPKVDRFVFAARGNVGEHLDGFITRMKAEASVALCDWPPLDYLQQYVVATYPTAFTQRSLPPATGTAPLRSSMQRAA